MTDTWQAGAARHSFSKLVDAAVDGHPQFVRRRDGREVVVVSKEYYERTKPGLKSVLLSHRFGERGDMFDTALGDARAMVGTGLVPDDPGSEVKGGNNPGHRRP